MAAKQEPETVRLVDQRGNTVTVAADKADVRLATGYVRPDSTTRKASSTSDAK